MLFREVGFGGEGRGEGCSAVDDNLHPIEDRPEFEAVYPLSKDERPDGSEVGFRYSMRYKPSAAPFPIAGAKPARPDAATGGEDEQ